MPDLLAEVLALPGLGWLILATVAAGLVRGFSGFGSAMIIMPAAGAVLGPAGAITYVSMTELLGPVPNLKGAWAATERRDVALLLAGALAGLPVGVLVLAQMPKVLFGWLVSALVLTLLAALIAGWRYRGRLTGRLTAGIGVLGGFLGSSVGLPGPPVIMLYMASTLPVAAIRANLMIYLFFIDVMMIASLWAAGLLAAVPMVAGLAISLPYMGINWLGARLFDPARERVFRAVAYVVIATSAVLGLPVWS